MGPPGPPCGAATVAYNNLWQVIVGRSLNKWHNQRINLVLNRQTNTSVLGQIFRNYAFLLASVTHTGRGLSWIIQANALQSWWMNANHSSYTTCLSAIMTLFPDKTLINMTRCKILSEEKSTILLSARHQESNSRHQKLHILPLTCSGHSHISLHIWPWVVPKARLTIKLPVIRLQHSALPPKFKRPQILRASKPSIVNIHC